MKHLQLVYRYRYLLVLDAKLINILLKSNEQTTAHQAFNENCIKKPSEDLF